ncbi:MAG: hypothetical protein ACYTG0_21915 [Planctomycetota bacterium]|jgi:hypothetical protein
MNRFMMFAAIGLFLACSATPSTGKAQITADDFLPPVQGGPTDVKQPDQVEVQGDVVTAATAQDAINVAVQENLDDLSDNVQELGGRMVRFPSGLGFVASGAAVYRTVANPVATRIAQRKAYVIAFTRAKKGLAETLGGLSNEGKETIRQELVNINLPDEEMTNISTQSEEALRQTVDMMLRGFVIYEVKDDTAQNTVYVSIATTPKTRGQFARPAPNMLVADDLRDGLNQIISEVRTGLVPPVGSRIVRMESSGETAFVGFGSSIIRTSENRAVQLRLNLTAQKVAAAHAKDALCGLILGDKASWKGRVVESLRDEVQEFESLVEDDPLARKDPLATRKLDEARQTFVARLETTDVYRSVRQGVLPPGVTTKTWFDEDHAWAYGMSVYVPSLTSAAASAAREMQDSRIVQPTDGRGVEAGTDRPNRFPDQDNPNVKRPGAEIRPGPTGKIAPDEDL